MASYPGSSDSDGLPAPPVSSETKGNLPLSVADRHTEPCTRAHGLGTQNVPAVLAMFSHKNTRPGFIL